MANEEMDFYVCPGSVFLALLFMLGVSGHFFSTFCSLEKACEKSEGFMQQHAHTHTLTVAFKPYRLLFMHIFSLHGHWDI